MSWETREGRFEQRVLLTGSLKAVRSENLIVPQNPTWQVPIRWLADDGARVAEGDPVVELDNTAQVTQLGDAAQAEDTAVNELDKQQAELAGQLAEKRFQLEQKRIAMEKKRSSTPGSPRRSSASASFETSSSRSSERAPSTATR